MNLLYYKNRYFGDRIFVSNDELINDFRNNGIKINRKINENIIIDYNQLDSIELLKLICDKVFFFQEEDVKNSSIKNMLYKDKLIYQDFYKISQIESYLYRLINEKVNRTLIFTDLFSDKNNPNNITLEQKTELINNLDNDIIYLSDNIILITYKVYLPWLWECRKEKINYLKKLSKIDSSIKTYYLKNKWDFKN